MGCGASRRLDCPLCNLVSTTNVDSLIRHVNASHTLRCPQCAHSFGTGKDLIDHNLREHGPTHGQYAQPVIKCPKCNKTNMDGDELLKHLEDVHDIRSRAPKNSKQELQDGKSRGLAQRSSGRYSKYSPEHGVHSHEDVHLRLDSDRLECPICHKKDFITGPAFVDHLRLAHSFKPPNSDHAIGDRNFPRNTFEQSSTLSNHHTSPKAHRPQSTLRNEAVKEDDSFLMQQDIFNANPTVTPRVGSASRNGHWQHHGTDDTFHTDLASAYPRAGSASHSGSWQHHASSHSLHNDTDHHKPVQRGASFSLHHDGALHNDPFQRVGSTTRNGQWQHHASSNSLDKHNDHHKPIQKIASISAHQEEVFHSNPSAYPRAGSAAVVGQKQHSTSNSSLDKENIYGKPVNSKPVQHSESFSLHEEHKTSPSNKRRSFGNGNPPSGSTSNSSTWSLKELHKFDSDLSSPEQSRKYSQGRTSPADGRKTGKKNNAQPKSARTHDSVDKLKIQTIDKVKIQTRLDQDAHKTHNGSSFGNQHSLSYEDNVHKLNQQNDEDGPFPGLKKNGRVRQRMKSLPAHPENPYIYDYGQESSNDTPARSGSSSSLIPKSYSVLPSPRDDQGKRSQSKPDAPSLRQHKEVSDESKHLWRQLVDYTVQGNSPNEHVPSVGDKVFASNSKLHWDFHLGRVLEFHPEKLEYKVQWGTGDKDVDLFDYENLALERSPSPQEIGVGTIVLFSQGQRYNTHFGMGSLEAENLKWHQGLITRVYTDYGGIRRADGHHTKSEKDGKALTFPGYSHEFAGFALDMLRIPLNPYEILGALEAAHFDPGDERQVNDIFFACAQHGKYSWFHQEDSKSQNAFHQPCDPMDLSQFLKGKGFSLYMPSPSRQDIRKNVRTMRESKIYVACIDNEYVKNPLFNAQFHYARNSLNMPMIPLVFAGQDKSWMQTSIGQALAKENCIHLENRSVMQERQEQLLRALKSHNVVSEHVYEFLGPETHKEAQRADHKQADIFISYSWANSLLAKKIGQVAEVHGVEHADPRLVNKKLVQQGYKTWINENRVDDAHGLRSQMLTALKSAKVLVAFISNEYAADVNCMSVLRYAIKSIKLPVIPVIVGKGDNWKSTAVGPLLALIDREALNIQYNNNDEMLNTKVKELKARLDDTIKFHVPRTHSQLNAKSKPPRARDRVVSRYTKQDYRMATVESLNPRSLDYTVTWDDGDKQNRVQPFDKVALDVTPNAEDVGIGSVVFVQQTTETPRGRQQQVRFVEGVITKVTRKRDAVFVEGYHAHQDPSRSSHTPAQNRHDFTDVPLSSLRLPPNMLDVADLANAH